MTKAVILACGGFESNPEMRARYLGQNWDLVKVRGTRYNTGDGIRMALDVGAMPFGHWSGCHASVIDADGANVEAATDESTRYSYPYGIMVNTQGERFVDEGEDFQVYTYAKTGRTILAQPGHIAYQIYDQKTVPLLRSQYLQSRPVIANTVEELASGLGIESIGCVAPSRNSMDRLTPQISISQRKTANPPSVSIRHKSNWATSLDSPPFHAYAVACGITFTYGGLKIDPKCRVLSSDETPIPGLWAVGELTGGFFYHNYPSGSGLMRGSITGHVAARMPSGISGENRIAFSYPVLFYANSVSPSKTNKEMLCGVGDVNRELFEREGLKSSSRYQCRSTTLIHSSSAFSTSCAVPFPPLSSRRTRVRCIFCNRTASSCFTRSLSIAFANSSGRPCDDHGFMFRRVLSQSSIPCSHTTSTSSTDRFSATHPVSARLNVRMA